ncbi:protein-L-isoaspartate(D-aspartate) O-methyltransferase [bacterium]|nr:protein-L-isoaspartate(D-aspartate) O-methyltransferase [bacterium]
MHGPPQEAQFAALRNEMVERQIIDRDVRDPRVLAAMRSVKRHLFVPERFRKDAYADTPLLIGYEQTISQPYVVASMTEHLALTPESRVLEIGTGCGYQTAVLAEIAREVYSIERIPELLEPARERLTELGYKNIVCRTGDGSRGWPERAPYDAIIVTAAAARIPELLLSQLKLNGKMVIPLASGTGQQLVKLTRTERGVEQDYLYAVRFVPLIEEDAD